MQAGTRLDHYEIVDKLGEGGMGAVYRANDTRLKRQVAIKVLPPELAADPERLARLEREAQLLASLNHPNVATVHGFGDVQADVDGAEQRVTFLVMELVEGESLYDRARMGPMPWREVVEIGIGIASGLEAAHEQGIVHRDLKPANVHLAQDGTVKVLDFGLAKAFDGEGTTGSVELSASPTLAAATRTGVILGTAAYMSPEQARGQVVDKRADIWALGCLLYELLVGRKTFDGGTVSDILASILKENADLDALPPVPATLRHVLERSLEKDPARRMRDVADLRLELEAARLEPAQAPADASRKGGVRWQVVAGVAAVASVASLGIGFLLWGGTAPALPEAHAMISPDSIAAAWVPMAISPDGRWIAEGGWGAGLRLRAMDGDSWRELDDTQGALAITFSADSQRLYFTRGFRQPEISLFRVDVFGNSPVLEGTFEPGFAMVSRAMDGRIVVSVMRSAEASLHALNANGTFTELYRDAEAETSLFLLHEVSPSRWLGTANTGATTTGLVFVDIEAGTTTQLLRDYRAPSHLGDGRILAVDQQGRLVSARIDPITGDMVEPPVVRLEGLALLGPTSAAYATTAGGTLVYTAGTSLADEETLGWLDPAGVFTPLTQRTGAYQVDSFVSPDGRYLALETESDETAIAIHDIERDVQAALVPGAPIAFPVWSPDSREVAYRFITESERSIYRAPIDRSVAPELLFTAEEGRYALPTSWSPDGKYILFVDSTSRTRASSGENNLWLLPLDGSEPTPFLQTDADEIDARFSPDGRWVAYASNQTGRREVYVRPLEGSGEFQISAEGGGSPEWNPAGGQIFFQIGLAISVVDIDITGATPIVSPVREFVGWSQDLKPNLWAPAPSGDRFLVSRFDNPELGDLAVRAIFNWPLLLEDW